MNAYLNYVSPSSKNIISIIDVMEEQEKEKGQKDY